MAIGKLAVVTEAFPLWPYWRERVDDKLVLFAVTLNTGLLATDADLRETFDALGADNTERSYALMPWRWTINGFKLCSLRKDDGSDAKVFDGHLLGSLPGYVRLATDDVNGLEGFKRRLEGYVDSVTTAWSDLSPLQLNPDALGEVVDSRPTLQGLLASVAAWPAPLAHMVDPATQGVNMAHLVGVKWADVPKKKDADGQTILDPDYVIVAAPLYNSFAFEDGVIPSPGEPAYEWEYADATVRRVAYCGPAILAPPDRGKVQYDPTSYFVGKSEHGIADTLGGNPVADLPLRIAEQFDLGALIVEEMNRRVREAAADATKQITEMDWETARQAVMAVGRDMAGVGFQPSNVEEKDRQESLLGRLVGELAEEQGSAEFVELVRLWQTALSLNDWEKLVIAVAPDVPDTTRFVAVGSNPAQTEPERNQARLDAIGRINSALRENDVLQKLLPAQIREAIRWAATLTPPHASLPEVRRFWERVEHRLTSEILPTYNLSQALALDHIRGFLHERIDLSEPGILPTRTQLFDDSGNPKEFRAVLLDNFVQRFVTYAAQRLGGGDPVRMPNCPPFAVSDSSSHARKAAEHLVRDAEDKSEFGPATPTPRPHALTIPVAPLNAPGDPEKPEDNISTDIAGYGALIQRTTTNRKDKWEPWRLPVMATVRLDQKPTTYLARYDGMRLETAVPLALGYGALREGFLTYDEQSLAARHVDKPRSSIETPEADSVPVVDFIFPSCEIKDKDGKDILPVFDPDGLGKDWRELPELAFGAFYRLAPFVFGQGCVLPPALAHQPELDTAEPAPHVLKLHDQFAPADIPADTIRETRYLRRVPVGTLRIQTGNANLKEAQAGAEQVVTIAGALPSSGRLVHKASNGGRFFHIESEGGALDIFSGTVWSLRFGGLKAGAGNGVVLQASWAWDAGSAASVEAKRNGNNLDIRIGSADVSLPGVFATGVEAWVWLQLQAETLANGKWSVTVQGGTLGVVVAAQTVEVDKASVTTNRVWLQIDALEGDLLFQPSATVDGFSPVSSAGPEAAVLLMSNRETEPKKRIFKLPAEVKLGVRPPAVGDDTFARWLRLDQFKSANEAEATRWRKVIEYASVALAKLNDLLKRATEGQAALEDPAVTHIVAELVPVRGSQSAIGAEPAHPLSREVRAIAVSLPRVDLTNPASVSSKEGLIAILKDLAQTPTNITAVCKIVDVPSGVRLIVSGTAFEIEAAPGEVWDLRLYPAARKDLFEADIGGNDTARFHPRLGAPQTLVNVGGDDELVLFSPMDYRIEAAREDLPAKGWKAPEADPVWSALVPRVDGDLVQVNLARPGNAAFAPTVWQAWDNIGKASLGYQAFVWSGRPLESYPFAKADGSIDRFPEAGSTARNNVMLWEASAFENQEGRAPLTEIRTVAPGANRVVLFETDLTAERNGGGAHHYRFRLDIHHRYAALVDASNPDLNGLLSHAAAHATGEPKMMERWKRLFIPARPRNSLPPPAVTFAVPLTDGVPGQKVPGLIAYLDEPWAAIGGLAEILDVQIAPAFEPADGELSQTPERRKVEEDRQWPEYGPDPIIRSANFNGRDVFVPVGVSDLIGQTFDTGTATPGIYGASALIPPPVALDAAGEKLDPAWSMAKLRFRRILHPMAVANRPVAIETPTTILDGDLVLAVTGLKGLAAGDQVTLTAGARALVALTATKPDADIVLVRAETVPDTARVSPISISTAEQKLYICLRRAGLRSGSGSAEDQGFEVTVYADDKDGVWRPAGLGMVPTKLSENLELKVTGSAAKLGWSRAAFSTSDWTPAYWSQYLGAIANAADSSKAVDVANLQLRLAGTTGENRKKLEIVADKTPIQLKRRWPKLSKSDPDLPPGGWKDHSGLYYRVLVTKTVYDASGTLGGEAVIGLYEGESDGTSKLAMIWPDELGPDLVALGERLLARIMLWQEAPAALTEAYSLTKPWDMIFPGETEGGGRREARARILQVSPPISSKTSA